jgi:transposase
MASNNGTGTLNLPPLEELMAMDPSIVIPQLYAMVKMLLERVHSLEEEVKELKAKQNRDSHNSHKPPSSDTFKKKPVNLRKPSDKRPGGQPGHPGNVLEMVEKPDETVHHRFSRSDLCRTLSGAELQR